MTRAVRSGAENPWLRVSHKASSGEEVYWLSFSALLRYSLTVDDCVRCLSLQRYLSWQPVYSLLAMRQRNLLYTVYFRGLIILGYIVCWTF